MIKSIATSLRFAARSRMSAGGLLYPGNYPGLYSFSTQNQPKTYQKEADAQSKMDEEGAASGHTHPEFYQKQGQQGQKSQQNKQSNQNQKEDKDKDNQKKQGNQDQQQDNQKKQGKQQDQQDNQKDSQKKQVQNNKQNKDTETHHQGRGRPRKDQKDHDVNEGESHEAGSSLDNLVGEIEKRIQKEKGIKEDGSNALEALKSKGWEVKTEGNQTHVNKKVDDIDVHIVFYSNQKEGQQKGDKDQKQQGQGKDIKSADQGNNYNGFSIYLKKPGSNNYMYADYRSNKGNITLDDLDFIQDLSGHRKARQPNRQQHMTPFSAYDIMDDRFMRNLERHFFDRLGFDDEIRDLLGDFSGRDRRTHRLRWLEELRNFLK